MIILKRILEKDLNTWNVFVWLKAGTSEHANETSGFVKCWEFRDHLNNY